MNITLVEPQGELVRYEAAKRAIAEAASVDEVKDWHDKAAAIKAYARQVNDRQMELDAAEIRMRAERRLGEMLKQQKETVGLNTGGRPKTGADEEPVLDPAPTLAEVGIDKKLSSRAQSIAAIPEEQFESTLSEHREQQKAVTQSTMSKLAKQGEQAKSEEERQREKSGRPEWMSVEDFRTGIQAHGWIKTLVRETSSYDPGYIAQNCLPEKIQSGAKRDAQAAINWLTRFSQSLGGENV